MSSRSALLITSVATLIGGCGGPPEATGPVPVASVDVQPSEATVDVGESIQLVATPRAANGNALSGRVVTWSSSHPTSVAVDEDGMVTRTGAGTATITATSEGVRGIGTISEPAPLVFTSLSLGTYHSCGLTGAGIAYCWGKNTEGQLGDGSVINRVVPKPVAGGLTFVSLSARGAAHSCGVTTDGAGYCWGSDENGQLGDGSTLSSPVPLPIAGGLIFASITVERSHTCGITIGGQAYCWGYNGFAQLGDGSKISSPVPVPVAGGLEWTSISPGSSHTCGLTTAGTAYCWGANETGQLGIGTKDESLVPVLVAGGLTLTALVSRDMHTCGLAPDGSVYCWGSNIFGELGDGTTAENNLPVQVAGLSKFLTLGAGSYHTCAITLSGDVSCWGANAEGQLGIGNTAENHIPIQVSGGHSFAVIGVGCFHTCGVTKAGTTYCWGRNDEGQLGNGSPDDSMIPVAVVARAVTVDLRVCTDAVPRRDHDWRSRSYRKTYFTVNTDPPCGGLSPATYYPRSSVCPSTTRPMIRFRGDLRLRPFGASPKVARFSITMKIRGRSVSNGYNNSRWIRPTSTLRFHSVVNSCLIF